MSDTAKGAIVVLIVALGLLGALAERLLEPPAGPGVYGGTGVSTGINAQQ